MIHTKIEIKKDIGFGAIIATAGEEKIRLCVGSHTIELSAAGVDAVTAGFAAVRAELAKYQVPTLRERIAELFSERTGFGTADVSRALADTGETATHEAIVPVLTSLGFEQHRDKFSSVFVWSRVGAGGLGL